MSSGNIPDDVKLVANPIVLLKGDQIPAYTVLCVLDTVKRNYEEKLTRGDEAGK